MCIDFIDLKKTYPKDNFPLPKIDQLIDAMVGHRLRSFMDAFSGCKQIKMYEPNQEKTTFNTNQGMYCYKVICFSLNKAGVTCQRFVNKIFKDHIECNIEVYVDDMLTMLVMAK